MSEKRFTKCCPKIRDYDEEMSCTEVCDLLNKFYEENKELKKQINVSDGGVGKDIGTDYFVPIYSETGKIIGVGDNRYGYKELYSINEIIDVLNEEYGILLWNNKKTDKLRRLLEENTKPTIDDGGDVYLSIGDDKRCRYEKTFICNKCKYFSTYFLDCRLMMEDKQYRKAIDLGLVRDL